MAKIKSSGVTGTIEIEFAIPTDDANVWRHKNGSITFESGLTTDIEVEGGYIPYARGTNGLTVTYCIYRSLENQGPHAIADVAMMTCLKGRVMDSVDIAHGVKVILPPDMAEALSATAPPKD